MKPTLQEIADVVCEYTGVSIELMRSKLRRREPVYARQLCMYFMRRYTKHTLLNIGDFVRKKGMDHTSVIHGVRHIEDLICTEDSVKQDVINLKTKMGLFSSEKVSETLLMIADISQQIPSYKIEPCSTLGELAEQLNNKLKKAG